MLNIAEYQETLNQDLEHKLDFQTYQQELDNSLINKQIQLQKVEDDIARLNHIIVNNKKFSNYIESKRIYVKNPNEDGEPIRVTKETLLDYDFTLQVDFARKSLLLSERNSLKRQIAEIEASQEKQMTLDNLPTAEDEMKNRLASVRGINSVEVSKMLSRFKKERKNFNDNLINRTKTDNPWIEKAYEIISAYSKELSIPFDYKIDIFTRNLKGKSGAILHKMVFIYKLAYVKLLSEKIGYPVPIFCDSPSGREVMVETISHMLNILKRDFAEHQIFISSIYKYDGMLGETTIFEIDGTLFDKPTPLC